MQQTINKKMTLHISTDGSIFGINATDETLKYPTTQIPLPSQGGKIETLNQMGLMTPDIDDFSSDFIHNSQKWAKQNIPVLDIGSAYGVTAIPALENNGIVIANDMCDEHLLHLRENAPKKLWHNLYLNNKKLGETLTFPPKSIGSILIRRVLHFFTPNQIMTALDHIQNWLVPGGELYIIVMNPHHYSFETFKQIYEDRWNAGNSWPGEIENMYEFAPDFQHVLPKYFHVMDERPLKRELQMRNFNITKSELFGVSYTQNGEFKGMRYYGVKATINQ